MAEMVGTPDTSPQNTGQQNTGPQNASPQGAELGQAERWIERASWVGIFILAALFLGTMVTHAENFSFFIDDDLVFLQHFMERFIGGDTIWDKILYPFSSTIFPHGKLTGRVITILQYWTFGEIHFGWMRIIGSATLIGTVLYAKQLLKLSALMTLTIALMFWVPSLLTFWTAPITGYPFLILLALLTFSCLVKGRIFLAWLCYFFATFAHTPGLAIGIAALPLFWLPQNKSILKVGLWVVGFAITSYLFSTLALDMSVDSINSHLQLRPISGTTPVDKYFGSREGLSLGSNCVGSILAYQGQLITSPLSIPALKAQSLALHPRLSIFVSICFILLSGIALWRAVRVFDTRIALLISFFLICAAPLALVTLLNDNCETLTDGAQMRYVLFSILAWSGLLCLLTATLRPTPSKILLIGICALLVWRAVFYYGLTDDWYECNKTIRLRDAYTTLQPYSTKHLVRHAKENAISLGYYRPYRPPTLSRPAITSRLRPNGPLIVTRRTNEQGCLYMARMKTEISELGIQFEHPDGPQAFELTPAYACLWTGDLSKILRKSLPKKDKLFVFATNDQSLCKADVNFINGDKNIRFKKTIIEK